MASKSPTLKDVMYALGHAGEFLEIYDNSKWRLSRSGQTVSPGVVNTIRNSGMVKAVPNGNLVWLED